MEKLQRFSCFEELKSSEYYSYSMLEKRIEYEAEFQEFLLIAERSICFENRSFINVTHDDQ